MFGRLGLNFGRLGLARGEGVGGIRALPATLGAATLVADWRADLGTFTDASGTVPAASGDLIYTWTDQQSGLLAQEATQSERPIAYADATGRKIVRMRGQPGSRLTVPYDSAFQPGSGEFHAIAVVRNLSDNLSAQVGFGNNTSTLEGWSILINDGLLIVRCHDGTTRASRSKSLGSNCMSGPAVIHLELTGSAIKGRLNGSEDGFVDGGGGPTAATYSLAIDNADALIFGANPVVVEPTGADFLRLAIYKVV